MKVKELMTRNPVYVAPQMAVADVAHVLITRQINGVPVVDSTGNLLGIVTEGDLVHRAADERLEPRESVWKESFYYSVFRRHKPEQDKAEGSTAEQVMTRDVLTVAPDSNITVAARLLADHNIKSLPVIEDAKLVGMISRFDLLKCLADNPDSFNPMSRG